MIELHGIAVTWPEGSPRSSGHVGVVGKFVGGKLV
jgi:hypothetical protein